MRKIASRGAMAAFIAMFGAGAARAADCTAGWTGSAPAYFNSCNWSTADRNDFYTRDQGSRLIPLSWLRFLKRPDGSAFLPNGLEKYGYLPNPAAHTNPFAPPGDQRTRDISLPIGFTANGPDATAVVGMTCSACHTRQLTWQGKSFRIDGGPAISDFQALLADLDAAVKSALDPAQFPAFAAEVLGPGFTPADTAQLKADMQSWFASFDGIVRRALPDPRHAWQLGRLDAVSMIFDRVAGIDIAPAGHANIPGNIQPADAPVRYPFIWNANIQDKTQWPGFAQNGSDQLALLRNLGEVYGVFAVVHPVRIWPPLWLPGLPIVDFVSSNSANFDGLAQLENSLKKIPSPQWPPGMKLNGALAARGAPVFTAHCAGCHGVQKVDIAPWLWKTQIDDAHTDHREYDVMARTIADPGVLKGMLDATSVLHGGGKVTIEKGSTDFAVLANTVLRSVIGHYLQSISFSAAAPAAVAPANTGVVGRLENTARANFAAQGGVGPQTIAQALNRPELAPLKQAYSENLLHPAVKAAAVPAKYEARVLHGIWAAAPYLHNGSVPTLADLLLPACSDAQTDADAAAVAKGADAACRPRQFALGAEFDPVRVGLAANQGPAAPVRTTTDATDIDSGNSRAGHDYGTLSKDDRAALLEYLKTL